MVDGEAEISALRPYFNSNEIITYFSKPAGSGQRLELRNQIVSTRMYAIDLRYKDFERRLDKELRGGGFATNIISIALTGTAALFGGAETKAILAGVDTALKGGKKAYQDDVLIEQTLTILTTQMRARRKRVAAKIWQGLTQSDSQYPLPLALSQIGDYEYAGTLRGALKATTEEASQQLDQAQRYFDSNVLKVVEFNPSETGDRVRKWLEVDDTAIKTERIRLVQEWFGKKRINLKGYDNFYTYILSGKADESVLRILINDFRIP